MKKILLWLKEIILQKVDEIKLEDYTFQNIDEEVKDKKIELIEKNDKNQEMENVGNTVEKLYIEKNIFHNDYAKVKEENMDISKETNEDPKIEIVEIIKDNHVEINLDDKPITNKIFLLICELK